MRNCVNNIVIGSIPSLIVSIALLIIVPVDVYAQSFAVTGAVTASTMHVRYVSVTFIDKGDTTKKVTVLTDTSGNYSIDLSTSVTLTGVRPAEFELEQNYPNPFYSSTVISYQLNKPSDVKVTIYDILGREIKKFTAGIQAMGGHGVLWDGKNNMGDYTHRGIYFYRLQAQGETQVKKLIYGFGGKNVIVSPAGILTPKISEARKEVNSALLGGNFIVRIENTDSTFPAIVDQQFDTTVVQSNTVLDFTVSSILTYPNTNTATIYFENPQQVIKGFGASNVLLWRPDMTESEINTAFGTGDGQVGFSILRIMAEADSNRWGLYVPTAKKAQDLGATIIASPWYAPSRMVETVNGKSRVRYDMYAAYTAHLNSFNVYMKNNGVSIYGLSIQNEPEVGNWTKWTAAEMLTFMKEYAHVIEGIEVMAPESFHFDRSYSDPILNDPVACANTDIICGHIYGSGLTSYPLAKSKGKEVWMTEFLSGETSQGNDLNWSISAAKSISDVMTSGMNAYVWWNIVRFYGPIDDGDSIAYGGGRKGEVTKKGYMMSQFSRFVRPGFTRVDVTDNNLYTTVDVTAYKNGYKHVIVVVNRRTTAKTHIFTLWNGTAGTFTPYVTSSTKNCQQQSTISYKNGTFTYMLEPLSVTTFVSD